MHRERILTIEFIIQSPCWFYCFVVRTLKFYSFSKSPLYNTTVLSIVVIMLYISSSSFSFKSESSICLFDDLENCKRVKKRKKKTRPLRTEVRIAFLKNLRIPKCFSQWTWISKWICFSTQLLLIEYQSLFIPTK